jgi:hypothetical protein
MVNPKPRDSFAVQRSGPESGAPASSTPRRWVTTPSGFPGRLEPLRLSSERRKISPRARSRACWASPASCTPPKTAATCAGSCAARFSAGGARRYARRETAPMPQEPEMLPDLKVASPESTINSVELVRRSPASPTTSHPHSWLSMCLDFLRRGRTRTSGLQRHYDQPTAPRPTRLPGSCSVVCRRELRRSSTTRSRGRSTGPAQHGVALRHLLFRLPARLPAAKLRW